MLSMWASKLSSHVLTERHNTNGRPNQSQNRNRSRYGRTRPGLSEIRQE